MALQMILISIEQRKGLEKYINFYKTASRDGNGVKNNG